MKQRYALLSVAAVSFVFLFTARHHLSELRGVLTTYTTFYPYLHQHPPTLYRYTDSTATASTTQNSSRLIPPIIHQIFLSEGRPAPASVYKIPTNSCKALHPDWTYNLWTDEAASAFIRQYYSRIRPHYEGYKRSVQRANILRYALLHHFGGVYLDLDVTCLQPLDNLRYLPFLTPGAYPAGLNNAFMLTRPHHPFLTELLSNVEASDLSWGLPYVEAMLTTGCMFLSSRWMSFVRSSTGGHVREEDRVYVLADDAGRLGPHMLRGAVRTPLFRHRGVSSWHEWDAAAIVLIGEHYCYFITIAMLGAALAITTIWRSSTRSQGKTRERCVARLRRTVMKKSADGDGSFV